MVCSYKNCSNEFEFKSNKKFCSRNCKQKNSQSKNKKRILRSKNFFSSNDYGYRHLKKERCEKCGFIPQHKCQLDVDHIDGNHKNNNIKNLQTLCANCHRLKTYVNRDWEK